ncbi:MAG: PD40 domain-containing protein [Acidobacteria bacterium]|nr:PD40 domain-containing protein [Acidobacteriota bacterium]
MDLSRGELRKHGLPLKLQEQPYRVLAALVEARGQLVTREELKHLIWGNETFVDFNHGLSSAVNRLRDLLGDSADRPRYIETVARKGYRFIAPLEFSAPLDPQAPAGAARPPLRSRRPFAAVMALAATLLIAGLAFLALRSARPPAPPSLEQLTALIGSESQPSLSPDGRQIAFVYNGEKEDNPDIYVQTIGDASPRRLTSHRGSDLLPSWSPDGANIAFVRVDGATGFYLTSALGGPERKIFELPGLDHRPAGPESRIVGDLLYPIASRPSWAPDSKSFVFTRRSEPPQPGDGPVYRLPIDGGPPSPILIPEPGASYAQPTLSPDGSRLAVISCSSRPPAARKCDLLVQPLSSTFAPSGRPLTLLSGTAAGLRGIAWSPSADSLIVSGFHLPHYYAWRIPIAAGSEPKRIELAGVEAMWPSLSGARLAFSRSILQADLYRLDLGSAPAPFLSSTARDIAPAYSPDGRHIAFQSGRGGINDIWVASSDGSSPIQLTRQHNRGNGSPAWSPDGRFIAFDSSLDDGKSDVWVAPSEGGPLRCVTGGPGHAAIPSWSHDGSTIFFYSTDSGRPELWQIPTAGGTPRQVTKSGGFASKASPDGRFLYYTKSDAGTEGIFALPLHGGSESHIVQDQVVRRAFDLLAGKIFYITPLDPEFCELRSYDIQSGRKSTLARIQRPVAFGLAVAPSLQTFVFSRPITGADLMLIDNFN